MIKGLTDNVLPRFPRLGKLRKGSEQQDKNGKKVYGKDLDYFRFTSENPAIVDAFHAAYGNTPATLHVYLPYPTVDLCFSTWKEHWSAGGLMHRCDGETCTIWRTPDGKYSQVANPCPGGCDEVGRLEVILPELIQAGFVGYVTLETHSLHDMMNMTATLLAVAQQRLSDPRGLQGIEFVLRRKLEKISAPSGDGKRASRDKWLVSLEPVASWAQTHLALASNSMLAIEGGTVDIDTGEMFDDDMIDGTVVQNHVAPHTGNGPVWTDPADDDPDGFDDLHSATEDPAVQAALKMHQELDRAAAADEQGHAGNGKPHSDRPFKDQGSAVQWACRFEYYRKDGKPDIPHAVGSLNNVIATVGCKEKEVDCWANAWIKHVGKRTEA